VREVLHLAYPLILSQLSFTLQTFIDRLFLTWYSPEALAGAVAGMFLVWIVLSLCIGTGEYVTAFVGQYIGAGRLRRVGPALGQGLWFSLISGIVIAACSPLAADALALSGHAPAVLEAEQTYARLLMLGAFPTILMPTLASFFAGRGRTGVILVVNVVATLVNLGLDWLLIFGNLGAPRLGVTGAALGTIASQAVGALAYLVIILRPAHRTVYGTGAIWRPERTLLVRLLRFGLPAGLHYSAEVMGFALFMVVVGRIGTMELAATSIAFNLNMIVFMPMVGCGLAVTALVSRYMGAERPDLAERVTWSALQACMVYMTFCGLGFVLLPELLLAPYAAGADPATFGEVARLTGVLLRFVAFYTIFDTMNVIFAAGLKGAGDTRFPVLAAFGLSWLLMVGPSWLLCVSGPYGVLTGWTCASLYVLVVGVLMMRRFQGGGWRTLRLIEPQVVPELDGERTPTAYGA
jgi:MATE family multidrug resistance protein